MGAVAQALGVLPEFEFEGRAYKVAERTLDVEALFELYCEDRALNKVRLHFERKSLTPVEYEIHCRGIRGDMVSGVYSYGTADSLMVLLSPPGRKEMQFLRLADANRDKKVDRALIDRVWKDDAKLRELEDLMARADDPNRGKTAQEEQPAANLSA